MPQTTKAAKVAAAARTGVRATGCSPCSSAIMVSIQRSRSAVITSTAGSSASPENPLARRIWRTSSRSPSGTASMCRSSMARSVAYSSASVRVLE